MEMFVAVLVGLLFAMTFAYFDLRWQFRQYKKFIFEELFKDEDMHKIPTEPLFVREPLPHPKEKDDH